MSDEHAIVAEGLEKSYGKVRALAGHQPARAPGHGPRPAGAQRRGEDHRGAHPHDPARARRRERAGAASTSCATRAALRAQIGLAGQYAAVDENLTGSRTSRSSAGSTTCRRAIARARRGAARALRARGGRDGSTKTYSGGMRRRLDLAAALVARPPVLFLDEPTTGLDPRSRLEAVGDNQARATEGTTVLLTTQYLDEADRLADRIAVVDHGR